MTQHMAIYPIPMARSSQRTPNFHVIMANAPIMTPMNMIRNSCWDQSHCPGVPISVCVP